MRKLMLLIFLLICFASANAGAEETVRVTKVIDGDTIEVELADGAMEKVRLIGINAPELFEENGSARALAERSKSYAKNVLEGKMVLLTYDESRTDMYGRVLAYLWIGDLMFNEQIIADGYAHAYLKFPFRDEYMSIFKSAEQYAKRNSLGLWKDPAFETAGSEDMLHHTSPETCTDKPPGR